MAVIVDKIIIAIAFFGVFCGFFGVSSGFSIVFCQG
jgi:hypothetical protein